MRLVSKNIHPVSYNKSVHSILSQGNANSVASLAVKCCTIYNCDSAAEVEFIASYYDWTSHGCPGGSFHYGKCCSCPLIFDERDDSESLDHGDVY